MPPASARISGTTPKCSVKSIATSAASVAVSPLLTAVYWLVAIAIVGRMGTMTPPPPGRVGVNVSSEMLATVY